MILGMHLTEALEEQSVHRHLVLQTGLEHDRSRAGRHGHNGSGQCHKDTGNLADPGQHGGRVGQGSRGTLQRVKGHNPGDYNRQQRVQHDNEQHRADQRPWHGLFRILDLAGHVAAGAHAVIGPAGGGDTGQQSRQAHRSAGYRRRADVIAPHVERSHPDEQYEGQQLDGGHDGLELSASLHGHHVDGHKHQDRGHGQKLDGDGAHGHQVGDILGSRQGHHRDSRGVISPEGGPAAEKRQLLPSRMLDIHVMTSVLRVSRSHLGHDQVLGNHDQTSDEKRKNRDQRAARGRRHLADGGENACANRSSHRQRDGRSQANLLLQLSIH